MSSSLSRSPYFPAFTGRCGCCSDSGSNDTTGAMRCGSSGNSSCGAARTSAAVPPGSRGSNPISVRILRTSASLPRRIEKMLCGRAGVTSFLSGSYESICRDAFSSNETTQACEVTCNRENSRIHSRHGLDHVVRRLPCGEPVHQALPSMPSLRELLMMSRRIVPL